MKRGATSQRPSARCRRCDQNENQPRDKRRARQHTRALAADHNNHRRSSSTSQKSARNDSTLPSKPVEMNKHGMPPKFLLTARRLSEMHYAESVPSLDAQLFPLFSHTCSVSTQRCRHWTQPYTNRQICRGSTATMIISKACTTGQASSKQPCPNSWTLWVQRGH